MFDKFCIEEEILQENSEILPFLRNIFKTVDISSKDDSNAQNIKTLYIGRTRKFLREASKGNAVLAILSEKEDLFEFPYAVLDIFAVSYSYVEMLYSRYLNIPLIVGETERLQIKEMDLEAAKFYFSLIAELPDIFDDNTKKLLLKSGNDALENFAASYVEIGYKFWGFGIWALYEKASGKLVGFAGLNNIEEGAGGYIALSYYIEENKRECGFAFEACGEIIKYAGEELGLKEIYCFVNCENTASVKLAEKLLFKPLKKVLKNKSILYLREL